MTKKSKKILLDAVLVIGLLLILPFLTPMQTYLHQAEKIASEKLGLDFPEYRRRFSASVL